MGIKNKAVIPKVIIVVDKILFFIFLSSFSVSELVEIVSNIDTIRAFKNGSNSSIIKNIKTKARAIKKYVGFKIVFLVHHQIFVLEELV